MHKLVYVRIRNSSKKAFDRYFNWAQIQISQTVYSVVLLTYAGKLGFSISSVTSTDALMNCWSCSAASAMPSANGM